MKKKRIFLIFVVIILALISLYFDSEIVNLISLIRNTILNEILIGLSFTISIVMIFFLLPSIFLEKINKKEIILPLWVTLIFSGIFSFFLKILIHRYRPFQIGTVSTWPILANNSHFVWNFSFPSFQVMAAFCALPILLKEFPKSKYIWGILAILVAFSRIYFGMNFLSDVLLSALIGYFIGSIAIKNRKKLEKLINKLEKKVLRI